MSKGSFGRKLQNKRWTGVGAVLAAVAEALGLVTTIAEKTEWYVPLAAFLIFVVLVVLHVLSLHNEIEDRDELLANRSRRKWVREQLDQFGAEYKAIMDVGDAVENAKIDQRLQNFCHLNQELAGYWTRFTAGSSVPKGDPPDWIDTPEKKSVWHRCQTRRFHLSHVIAEFKD